jgi:hypothetical protein
MCVRTGNSAVAFCAFLVSFLNALILVISTYHHASEDRLAFPLAPVTSKEEGQGRENRTDDCGDGC